MSDLMKRLGAKRDAVPRSITQEAPPRLRALLRALLLESNSAIEVYRELSDAAGQIAEPIWSNDWAGPRVREVADDLDWDLVYALLEKHAPTSSSGLAAYGERINLVLAREGIAYKMERGRFAPYDPEGDELNLAN